MPNNTALLLNGTGDFALLVGTSTPPAQETDYDTVAAMFGSVKSVKIENKAESKEHYGCYRGTVTRDDQYYTKHKLSYKVTTEEFSGKAIRALFFASQQADAAGSGAFTPLGSPQGLKGMARLRLWDKADQTNARLIHKDFLCIVTVTGSPDFKGDEWTSLDLDVEILSSAPGTLKVVGALATT